MTMSLVQTSRPSMVRSRHLAQSMSEGDLAGRLDDLRSDLLSQRRFRSEQLWRLTAVPADQVGLDAHDQVAVALKVGAEKVLADIDAALQRIEEGSYGRCGRCDVGIPLERLTVLPMVRLCMPCQFTHDRRGFAPAAERPPARRAS